MYDVGSVLSGVTGVRPTHTTSRENANELSMTDFLNLMVVQLQNQSIDSNTDTSDMLNQMVQMQTIQSLTDITDATIMMYAGSLVGKEVTVGSFNNKGELEERVLTITGTGFSDGQQVLFAGDEVIKLTDIMAVGRLPKPEKPGDTDKPEGGDKPDEVEPPEGGDKPDEVKPPEGGEVETPDSGDKEPDNSGGNEEMPPKVEE
ncbi:MAG: hypothetical protein HFF18_13520 [Oscillospiraceae bacterium]|nr:hypothetical protein [Oscillospiraceae bacterium]